MKRLLALALLMIPSRLAAAGPAWMPLGPYGGTIRTLAIDPANPAVLYACGDVPGVLKSTDGGASWVLLAGSPDGILALDPTRPATLYGATAFFPHRLAKSTDGGATWAPLGQGLPANSVLKARLLAVDPALPSRVYLGAERRGVWRSQDGGSSWQLASQGLFAGGNSDITALAVPRKPAGTVFAGTAASGLFKSTNAGSSWTAVRGGLPVGAVLALAVAPSDPRTLYASFEQRGVFRSTDGGATWRPAGLAAQPINALVVHPRSPRTVYAGSDGGVLRTTDGGGRWAPAGQPPSRRVLTLAVDPGTPPTLYAGTAAGAADPGGVLRSADGGANWERRTRGNLGLATVSVAADPRDPLALWAGTAGQDLWRTETGGRRWRRATLAPPPNGPPGVRVHQLVFASAPPWTLFAIASRSISPVGSLWKTADGEAWTRTSVPVGAPTEVFRRVRPDGANSARLYAASSAAVFRSPDEGASWSTLAERLFDCGLDDLALSPAAGPSPPVLYAGGAISTGFPFFCRPPTMARLFRSTDDGATWAAAGTDFEAERVTAIAPDPQDPNVVYAGLRGGLLTPASTVYRSRDGGSTWEPAAAGLPAILDLVASPVPGRLYAAVEGGKALRTRDGGATWQEWSEGLRTYGIRELLIDPEDPRRVFAATANGVWGLTEED